MDDGARRVGPLSLVCVAGTVQGYGAPLHHTSTSNLEQQREGGEVDAAAAAAAAVQAWMSARQSLLVPRGHHSFLGQGIVPLTGFSPKHSARLSAGLLLRFCEYSAVALLLLLLCCDAVAACDREDCIMKHRDISNQR